MSTLSEVMVKRKFPHLTGEKLGAVAVAREDWLNAGSCSERERMRAWFRYRLLTGEKIPWDERLVARLSRWWPK